MTSSYLKPTKFRKRTTQTLIMKQNFKVIIRKKEEWLKFKVLDLPKEREREQNFITQKRSVTDDFTK